MDQLRSLRPSADMDAAGRGADMRRIGDLDPHLLRVLAMAGYDTLERLRAAGDDELLRVAGVDRAALRRIRVAVGVGN